MKTVHGPGRPFQRRDESPVGRRGRLSDTVRTVKAADRDDLVELLGRRLGDRVPADAVAACLATAMDQLAGSVHPHDLPEMAFQLAMIRLATAADARKTHRGKPVPSS